MDKEQFKKTIYSNFLLRYCCTKNYFRQYNFRKVKVDNICLTGFYLHTLG